MIRRVRGVIAALALLLSILLLLGGWLLVQARTSDSDFAPAHAVTPVQPPTQSLSSEPIVVLPDGSERAPIGTAAPNLASEEDASSSVTSATVHGSLLDLSGEPIRGAWSAGIKFVDRTGHGQYVDAKEGGAYSLYGLAFGTYWLTAGAHGFRQSEETLELTPYRPIVQHDFQLEPQVELIIRVETPEGRNLFDVLTEMKAPFAARMLVPVATREPPGKRVAEVHGSLNNTFGVGNFWNSGPRVERLPPGCMGVLLLDGDLPVHVSVLHGQSVLQTKWVKPGTNEVVFVVSPDEMISGLASLSVRVVDAVTGIPIQQARLLLDGGTYFDSGSMAGTDADGRASIERREPGSFELRISAKGYGELRRAIELSRGETSDLGTVALQRGSELEGRVFDGDGRPMSARFRLREIDSTGSTIPGIHEMEVKSAADGVLSVQGLRATQYLLSTPPYFDEPQTEPVTWVSGNVSVDARSGSVLGLEVRLQPASRLILRVVGEDADGLQFRVVDEQGRESARSRFYGAAPRPLALPRGQYVVTLFDAQRRVLVVRPVDLGTTPVEVVLSR